MEKRMFSKKILAILFVLVLAVSMAIPLASIQTASAHTPPWTIPTYAFIQPTPNPVGVGQPVTVVMWLLFAAPTATGADAGDRWHDFKITITKPSGATEILGPFMADATGSTYTTYTPNEVGDYTFKLDFPGQVLSLNNPITGKPGANSAFVNDTFQASSATAILKVQSEPVREPASYPLPTEYWTRPIEGQNSNWWKVSSNWLGAPQVIDRIVQPDGVGPMSGHIMWTKPLQPGGVVGGSREGVEGNTYYAGMTYQTKFNQPIIMYGRLYYELSRSELGTGGGYLCVDLRTGEEIFYSNMSRPSYGQLLDYETMNQHGVLAGYLWRASGSGANAFLEAYDPANGRFLFNLTGVPSGTAYYTPSGEVVRYQLSYSTTTKTGWLGLWNLSAISSLASSLNFAPTGKTANASTAYSWNVTVPALVGTSSPAIVKVLGDDVLLGRSTAFAGMMADGTPTDHMFTMWALSLKPQSRGQLLWIKNYTAPPGQITLRLGPVDPINRVWTVASQEEMKLYGYSLDNGELKWTSDPMTHPMSAYNRMGATEAGTAYGMLVTADYSGLAYGWSTATGKLVWTYGNGGVPGNDTASGYTSAWGAYPQGVAAIADEKVYLYTTEHSPNSPLYKGALIRCLDIYTGKEVWTLDGWGSGEQGKAADFALADGYLVYMNAYDMQIYCVGKGPSAMTVEAPMTGVTQGSSIVIRGTITDISAGTNQDEQAARFPNGVPAMSDASMKDWMAYVYMQKPRPQDATGVPIAISVLDANGNYREIGNVTSDADGFFTYNWKPDIDGPYTVYASFGGSNSYWPSHAVTSFVADPEPTVAPTSQPVQALPPFEMYFAISTIAIIAVVLVAMLLLMKRKRP